MTRRRLLTWGAFIAVAVAAVLLALPVVSVLTPDYYRRYPALGPRMDHWSISTHSRFSCIECHVEPGIDGFLSFAAKAVPAFYSQLAQGPTDTNLLKAPGRRSCQQCHTTYRSVSAGGDLLIPHRAHVGVLGIDCVVCHKDLVHSLNRRGYNRPEMETCLKVCHDGDKATRQCVKCHTRKQTPASHLQKDWLEVHGKMAESKECGTCHDWTPGYCAECHRRRPVSHAGNWKKDHGPVAKARGEGCIVCHGGEKFCKGCH
jgi:hypothetical protein